MLKKSLFFLLIFSPFSGFTQTSWNSPQEALLWINGKIAGVKVDVMKYNQSFVADFSKSTACELLTTTEQNGAVNSSGNFTFYTENLNVSEISPEVKGMWLYLTITTQNNLKLIKETKQGETAGFTNSFRIYFDDLQVARDAAEAFKYISASMPTPVPTLSSKDDGYAWLQNNVGTAKFGYTTVEQSLKIQTDANNKFILSITETGSKTTKKEYEFYLSDFKAEDILVNASNTRLSVSLISAGDIKPIKYHLNGEQQKYTNKIEIFSDDAQKAFQIRATFIYLLTGKQDGTSQAANQTLGESIKGLFDKENTESNEKSNSTVAPSTSTEPVAVKSEMATDPLLRLSEENIGNPDYDNVPMWYDFSGKTLQALERKRYSTEARTSGMYSSESLLFFENLSSNVIFPVGSIPLFVIRLSSATTDPYTVIQLGKATINKKLNRREFIVTRNGAYKNTSDVETVNLVIQKKEPGIYYIKPEKPLPAGEYFFAQETGQQVHAFSVK